MNLSPQLIAAWTRNHRMDLRLMQAVGEEGLTANYGPRVRNVRRTFVHMHNARLAWLGAVLPTQPQVARLKSREAHSLSELQSALEASSAAITEMLAQIASQEVVEGFEMSPVEVLSFMVSHEAHHRGQIILALRLSGKPLPRDFISGLWED